MKNVDIIIPAISKKYGLIGSKLKSLSSDWYPVFFNKSRIESMGYKIRVFDVFDMPENNFPDILIVDSNIRRDLVNKSSATVEEKKDIFVKYLNQVKEKTKSLIVFDNSDSSMVQFYLLPLVDFYYKKQLFKDDSLYEKELFKDRLFADYYDKKYINPGKYLPDSVNIKNQANLFLQYRDKIGISWNILLAVSNYQSSFSKALYLLGKKYSLNYGNVDARKEYIISGNFFKDYKRSGVSFQRKKMHEFLSNHPLADKFSVGVVPKKEYRKNIMNSEFVVSPFGYGEVCYRDFEAFIAGAALIKPDMGHLATWPDMYKPDETYFPVSWDYEKWQDEFNVILGNSLKRKYVADTGQKLFMDLWSEKGSRHFSERFIKLIDFK